MKNTNLKFYDQLLKLHLFQGVGRSDLAQIVGHSKIGFESVEEGETIAHSGDNYEKMLFLTSGKAKVIVAAFDNSYSITETVSAPYTILPERIFGLSQSFPRTFVALTKCNILTMSKEEILKLTDDILIFRLNLLNTYTTMVQKKDNELWKKQPQSLEKRIANWMLARCLRPAGEKEVKIKMETLAQELNDSRLDISTALNSMQKAGLLTLSRGKIYIPHAEKL